MKIIAIALRTEPIEDLTSAQASLLEELLVDKRLTKAESIKAYRSSDKYKLKKEAYQSARAEFSQVAEIAIANNADDKVEVFTGEGEAMGALIDAVLSSSKVVGFDTGWQISFVLRRGMLTGRKIPAVDALKDGRLVDLWVAWARGDRAYQDLTLSELLTFSAAPGSPISTEDKAAQTMWLYKRMEGTLL